MERGICPTTVLYFAVICSVFKFKNIGQQGYKFDHRDILWPFWVMWCRQSCDYKIHSGWFPIGGPLTPTLYLTSLLRHIPIVNAWETVLWEHLGLCHFLVRCH